MEEQIQELTAQDIWQLFRETDRKFRETQQEIARQSREIQQGIARQFAETDRKFQETQESMARQLEKTDNKFWEAQEKMTRQFEETDRKFWEAQEKIARQFEETDRRFREVQQELARQFAETNRLFQESDAKLEKTRQQVSELTGSWGKFVESMVEPALVALFQARGIAISWTAPHVKCRKPGLAMEIDILGVNQEYVVVVEVKTTLKVADVQAHLQRLARVKAAFSEYQTRQVIGAVAGMRIEQEADKYAMRQGLFVLAQSGDAVQLLNDAAFTPRVW